MAIRSIQGAARIPFSSKAAAEPVWLGPIKKNLAASLPGLSNFGEATNGEPAKVPAGVTAFANAYRKAHIGTSLEINVIDKSKRAPTVYVASEPTDLGQLWLLNSQGKALASGTFDWGDGSIRWDKNVK